VGVAEVMEAVKGEKQIPHTARKMRERVRDDILIHAFWRGEARCPDGNHNNRIEFWMRRRTHSYSIHYGEGVCRAQRSDPAERVG